MKKIIFNRLNWMGFILFLIPIAQNYAQCIPSIGTAADFTIFSTVGALSNVNSSTIEGNIGTNAGTITGFTTSTITGNTHNADAITQNAANDLLSAYVAFQNLPATISSHAPAFGGGETLLAGIYHISGAGSIAGIVNLDAQNNTNAKFIIKVGGAFTIGANSIIVLNNGAQANNVYWIVEGAFTLAANCIFKGTIISGAAIDVAVNNQLNCKLLTVNGAISTYGTQLSITGITNSYPLYYADLDQDGYGNITTFSCDYITGYVLDASDCDDTDGTVHPNTEEIYGNNIDDNCNGITDTDTSSCGETTTWNGTLWNNGIPTYAKAAVFTSSYTSAADLYACSIWITNAATVILNTNLFVYGSITVDPGSYLTQNNNKNILQIDPSVMNTGAIQVKRNTSTLVRLDHTLWSSPVSFQNIYNFSPDTLPYRIYTYDTTTDSYLSSTLSNSSVFNIAQGYAIRAPNNQSSTVPAEWEGNFIGTPNNGTHSFTVDFSATHHYNLVGNPYPSTIDAATFIQDNSAVIEGTLYFYEHTLSMNSSGIFPTGTNYATWNATGGTAATSVASNDPAYHTPAAIPNGSIQVGQGFFIASKNNGNIEFNNSQRINDQNYQFLRASTTEKHRIWLNAKSEIGTDINQIMIGYLEGATLGKDTNYDGKSFGNIGSYLYSIIDSEQYVIQGRPLPFDASDEVYLGWKCAVPGNYSIQLSEWDGIFLTHQNVYIRDNLAGITTNIKQSPYYFTSNSGNFNNRFVLVFEANLAIADNSFSANNVIFYKDQGGLHITTEGIIMKDIFIYDLMGRLLYEANTINSGTITINEINQTKQIVLLKIVDQALQTVTLKIIN